MLTEFYSRTTGDAGLDIDRLIRAGVVRTIKTERPDFDEKKLRKIEVAGLNSKSLLDPTYLDPELAESDLMKRAFAMLMEK